MFQYQQVQLKDGFARCNFQGFAEFQYQQVQLKVKAKPRVNQLFTVSIPTGAIEGQSAGYWQNLNTLVSIPTGAIEGGNKRGSCQACTRFQYQQVQLKAPQYSYCSPPSECFNTNRCNWRQLEKMNKIRASFLFQYQQVQLKETRPIHWFWVQAQVSIPTGAIEGCSTKDEGLNGSWFQYQQVQLKGPMPTYWVRVLTVSIPTGAIEGISIQATTCL